MGSFPLHKLLCAEMNPGVMLLFNYSVVIGEKKIEKIFF